MLPRIHADFSPEGFNEAQKDVLQKMSQDAGLAADEVLNEDTFIAYFQTFRPHGEGLAGLFDALDCGSELHDRLQTLFAVAGDDRRPSGGRDAYFLVRRPLVSPPEKIENAGEAWIEQIRGLAESLGHGESAEQLAQVERVRVLEGIPPKHPKEKIERTGLLNLLSQEIPSWVSRETPHDPFLAILRSPFYFINCDAMLRDYLMWPLVRDRMRAEDPFEPYFFLWRHGVKWRVFQETQIDLYIPRPQRV